MVVKKGPVYKCGVCGLAVTVDEVCGYLLIICREKQMKPKKQASLTNSIQSCAEKRLSIQTLSLFQD